MPESPEVRIIAEQLNSKLTDHLLRDIRIIGGRYLSEPIIGFDSFAFPTNIRCVISKGKLIIFRFENGWTMFSSLGMTGSWGVEKEKHSALQLDFLGPGKESFSVYYTDPRRFGRLEFQFGLPSFSSKLKNLGPDLLSSALGEDPEITSEQFRKIFCDSNKTISERLMDQKIFSGVGNYIKSESLYLAGISPWRVCRSLTQVESIKLLASINQVMVESYQAGGATLATYKNVENKPGGYAGQLRVYGKARSPEDHVIKRERTKDGRTTWWDPLIQK